MPTTPTADITAVRTRLRDTGAIESVLGDSYEDAIDLAVQRALAEYSSDRPDIGVVDITGNGTSYYAASLLTDAGFELDWSTIRSIEYPAADPSATHTPTYIEPGHGWGWYYDGDGARYLYISGYTPAASEELRVQFLKPRVLTSESDTVPPGDKRALLDLATSYVCTMLATEASSMVDPVNRADTANYRDAQLRLSQQADAWRKLYERHMGLDKERATKPAGVLQDFDTGLRGGLYGGRVRPWLTHRTRR